MSQVRIADNKKKANPLWPVIGFLLALALGVIAYFLAPSVRDFVFTRFPNSISAFGTTTPENVQWIFTGAVFLLLLCLSGLVVAIAAPKNPVQVKDKDLVKQQKAMRAERTMKKKRRLAMEREMLEYNKNRNKQG
jgi:type III secretory pathway component EscU